MSSARIYARNLAANWVGHGTNLLVMLFLSPFIVHTLGPIQYGIWSLLNVLVGYLGIFDIGVRASTGRYIIFYLGKEDHRRLNETVRTGLGFYSAISVLIALVGLGLGWFFPAIFSSVPREYHVLVRILLPAMAANVWLSAISAAFSGVLAAHDRFDLTRAVDIVVLGLRTAATVLALQQGYGVAGLTAVWIASSLLAAVGNYALARKVYPRLKPWPLELSRPRLKELFSFGIPSFMTNMATRIIGQTDLVLVGVLISVSEVTTYSVGAMMIYYSSTFISQIGTTFFPPVQRAVSRGEMGPVRWLFLRQVRLVLIFGLVMNIGFIVFGRSFIRLWMLGPKFAASAVAGAAVVMALLAASKLLTCFTSAAFSLLTAMGHVRFTAAVSIVQAMVNLGLSIFFVIVLRWGLAGIAAGTLVARLLTSTFVLPWYACRKVGMNWWRFVANVGGRGCLCAALFSGACLLIHRLIPSASWAMFWLQVALALVSYAPIATVVLVPAEDRKRVFAKLKLLWRSARAGNHNKQ